MRRELSEGINQLNTVRYDVSNVLRPGGTIGTNFTPLEFKPDAETNSSEQLKSNLPSNVTHGVVDWQQTPGVFGNQISHIDVLGQAMSRAYLAAQNSDLPVAK